MSTPSPSVTDRRSMLLGVFFIMLAAVCWGLLGPVARVAFREGLSPLEVAFWRAVIGSLLFVMHAALTGRVRVARRHLPAMVLFGVLGVALFYSSYQIAVATGGAALASVLLYTAPAWVALMGVLWLGERLTPLKGLAVGLTILGVAGIALSGGRAMQVTVGAIAWGLVAGLSYALYYPFGKRYFAHYRPVTVFAIALPIGVVGLWPLVDFAPKSPAAWAALGWIGLVSTYGAYLAYGQGLQRLEASRAAILATLEPLVAAGAAYLWWGERFGPLGYTGAGLVLLGVLAAVLDPQRHTTPA